MSTVKQDRDFLESLIPSNILEDAVTWIGQNIPPEEVFEKSILIEWAEDNLKHLSESVLENWAEENGYTKE